MNPHIKQEYQESLISEKMGKLENWNLKQRNQILLRLIFRGIV